MTVMMMMMTAMMTLYTSIRWCWCPRIYRRNSRIRHVNCLQLYHHNYSILNTLDIFPLFISFLLSQSILRFFHSPTLFLLSVSSNVIKWRGGLNFPRRKSIQSVFLSSWGWKRHILSSPSVFAIFLIALHLFSCHLKEWKALHLIKRYFKRFLSSHPHPHLLFHHPIPLSIPTRVIGRESNLSTLPSSFCGVVIIRRKEERQSFTWQNDEVFIKRRDEGAIVTIYGWIFMWIYGCFPNGNKKEDCNIVIIIQSKNCSLSDCFHDGKVFRNSFLSTGRASFLSVFTSFQSYIYFILFLIRPSVFLLQSFLPPEKCKQPQ